MNEFSRDPQYFSIANPVEYKMPVNMSDEEYINHVWDIEQVRDVMSLRSFLNANDMHAEELSDLWVSKPENKATASLASNWGYYVGMAEIERFYVKEFKEKRQKQLDAACKNIPGLENKPENLGTGCMSMHPMSTALIRIADDGRSAKGIWYCIGQETEYQEDGTARSMWINSKIAADFAKEDGVWKLWHYVEANDQNYRAGEAYSANTYQAPGEDALEVAFGKPTIKMITHDGAYNYSDDYPPMPEPYATMTPKLSYGPEGHPKYAGGVKK